MISPCDLEFTRTIDLVQNDLQMALKLHRLHIHLTPPNIRLIMDVTEILKQSTAQVSVTAYVRICEF